MWYIFSFLNALFNSLKDVSLKEALRGYDKLKLGIITKFFMLIFFIIFLALLSVLGVNVINPEIKVLDQWKFTLALIIGSVLNTITFVLYLKVLQNYEMSASLPFLSFTPLFLVITSLIILKEKVNFIGFIGIMLIIIGAYSMNVFKIRYEHKSIIKKLMVPIKAILKQKGALYVLLIAMIWSISSTIDKVGVKASSVFTWLIAITFCISVLITIYYVISKHIIKKPVGVRIQNNTAKVISENDNKNNKKNKGKSRIKTTRGKLVSLMLPPLFSAMSLIFQMTAITLTKVAYAIAVKRLSIVFAVIFGRAVFKEEHFWYRLVASLIMFIGVIMVVLWG